MSTRPDDEAELMRRLKNINEPMYEEILSLEADVQSKAHESMTEIKEAKDLLLEYDVKGARKIINELKKAKKNKGR